MDRNHAPIYTETPVTVSLSARRAWIEIIASRQLPTPEPVALRKESVDRNQHSGIRSSMPCVALRKESVDRNIGNRTAVAGIACRSPQGERG